MIRGEMCVALDHDLRLPSTRPLHRIEIHAIHRETGGEGVPKVMEAEIRNARRPKRWSPVPLQVVQKAALRGREHPGAHHGLSSLNGEQGILRHAVKYDPSSAACLALEDM